MAPKRLIVRYALLSVAFLLIYLLLNQPAIIFISRLGSVAWYPANGVVLALMLGVSPWYALLVALADALAGLLIYHQPFVSFGETIGGSTVSVAVRVAPPEDAERVTGVDAATAPVVTLNVALVAPAATVTLAGTDAAGLLLESVTCAPPAGAGPFSVTVPVEEPPPVTLVGLTVSDETAGGSTVKEAVCVAPP